MFDRDPKRGLITLSQKKTNHWDFPRTPPGLPKEAPIAYSARSNENTGYEVARNLFNTSDNQPSFDGTWVENMLKQSMEMNEIATPPFGCTKASAGGTTGYVQR